MTYLLDTDILIFMIRGMKSSNRQQASRDRAQKLVDRCRQAQAHGDNVAVSAITIAELEFGVQQSDRPEDELRAIQKVLSPFDRVDFDAIQAPAKYGEVRHVLESTGLPIGAMDLLIAAHALSLQATLVTNNAGHFSRVSGLVIEN